MYVPQLRSWWKEISPPYSFQICNNNAKFRYLAPLTPAWPEFRTSAARPTYFPARGSENAGFLATVPSRALSAKELPNHLTLKYRNTGQNTKEDLDQRDLKGELEDRERKHSAKREREPKLLTDDDDDELDRIKRRKLEEAPSNEPATNALDEDDSSGSSSSSSSSSSDDDEDDAAELERELARLRAQRAEEKARQEELQAEVDEEEQTKVLLRSNPILNKQETGDYSLKKKWYEDVVFKNQAKGEPTYKKRFVNDTTRNDFHRKFLSKYVK